MEKIHCVMLIDDNRFDNVFHDRIIKKCNVADKIITMESAIDALEYLKLKGKDPDAHPDLIFLDINMPRMNGWEFIEEYKKLDKELQSDMIVVMLTTSDNPDDIARAKTEGVLADFKTKPLSKEMLEDVLDKFFSK